MRNKRQNHNTRGLQHLVFALAILAASPAAGQNSAREPGRQVCEGQMASGVPRSRLAILARGFNLPGWLEGGTPRRPDTAVLAGLYARGFTHIRLPVGAERLMEDFSSRGDVARQLGELDFAIDTLIHLGFGVTLDIHPADRFARLHVAEPDRALGLLEALWRLLARRYAGVAPDRLFFETLNEPTVSRKVWKEQGPRLVDAIRREAPDRTIIFGHADYQRIDALDGLAPLGDTNVVYAAHFYDPMIFTHQGLDWSDDPLRYLRDVPFPARLGDPSVTRLLGELAKTGRDEAAALVKSALREPWTEDRIDAEIARAASWSERYQRPVIINEFGALGWKAASADRARWLQTVRRAAERRCIGWTHWDYADGFGFIRRIGDREVPDQAIVRALLDH